MCGEIQSTPTLRPHPVKRSPQFRRQPYNGSAPSIKHVPLTYRAPRRRPTNDPGSPPGQWIRSIISPKPSAMTISSDISVRPQHVVTCSAQHPSFAKLKLTLPVLALSGLSLWTFSLPSQGVVYRRPRSLGLVHSSASPTTPRSLQPSNLREEPLGQFGSRAIPAGVPIPRMAYI